VKIAVLGTGRMGAPIARRLASAGHSVRVWNRTRERAEGLGAEVADTPVAAVDGVDAVITMLADGPAIEAVVPPLAAETLWVQMATIGVDETARLASHHLRYLDAPVLGSTPHAESGELLVFAAGADAPHEIFDAIAARVLRLSDEPGAATRLKLVVNLWLSDLVESLAESFALAEGLELDPRLFLEAISGMPMDTPYAHLKGAKMLTSDYSATFTLELALKDVSLALAAARDAGVELPVGEATQERYARAVAMGHGDKDTAAAYLAARRARS
jgi:3-hydroxyisobutyrate dehydrogenase